MKDIITFSFAKVYEFDRHNRTYTISTEDGRLISGCRKIGDVVNNTGGRKVAEIEKETEVLIILKSRAWVDAPDAYILGAFESFGDNGKYGTKSEKEHQTEGSQGFIANHGRRLLLYPDGTIELKAGAWCNTMYNPKDNSISTFFQKLIMTKDRTNFINWFMHPDSEDMSDALLQIGISGKNSLSKDYPDIEILAGALMNLKTEDFMHDKDFVIDDGAKLAVRITNPDGDKKTSVYYQVGDLQDGSIVHTQIKREGGVNAEIKIGDMDKDLTAMFRVNNAVISVFKDGRYSIVNDKTEIEATNDGTINIVCENSSLGVKKAENHIAIAEEVVDVLGDLLLAIQKSTYLTVSPGSPTKPGPINAAEFLAVKNKLKKIISKSHSMDN